METPEYVSNITVSVIFSFFFFLYNSLKNNRRDKNILPNTYISSSKTWSIVQNILAFFELFIVLYALVLRIKV